MTYPLVLLFQNDDGSFILKMNTRRPQTTNNDSREKKLPALSPSKIKSTRQHYQLDGLRNSDPLFKLETDVQELASTMVRVTQCILFNSVDRMPYAKV